VTGKERVRQALLHREADRVPVDFWSTAQMDAKLIEHLGLSDRDELLAAFGVDLRYIAGPEYVGPALRVDDDGTSYDLWGVPRRQVAVTGEGWEQVYWEVVRCPLGACRTVADVDAYEHWPSPEWFDYSVISAQCAACGDLGTVFEGDRLNRIAQLKPAMYLRGADQILIDMLVAPEVFDAIVGHIREFYVEYERRILQAADGAIDLLMTGDDFGMQNGPIVSPEQWRRRLKPGFAAFIEEAHRQGVPVMHHTCGSVFALLPDFIDVGLDVLQSLQPEAADMEPVRLKKLYGAEIAFQGGISIQRTLPFGTPEEVGEEAERVLTAMKPEGGFIAGTSHKIQADTPVENVLALIAAYDESGVYA